MVGKMFLQATRNSYAEQLINEIFSLGMLQQIYWAIDRGLITHAQLSEPDSIIGSRLLALTFLQVINSSSDCPGIRLGNHLIDKENCPKIGRFPKLIDAILQGKEMMKPFIKDIGYVLIFPLANISSYGIFALIKKFLLN